MNIYIYVCILTTYNFQEGAIATSLIDRGLMVRSSCVDDARVTILETFTVRFHKSTFGKHIRSYHCNIVTVFSTT